MSFIGGSTVPQYMASVDCVSKSKSMNIVIIIIIV